MARISTTLIVMAALAATAACTKKAPPELPPAPGEAPMQQQQPMGPSGPAGAVPGSAAHFKQNVRSDTIHFALDEFEVDAESRAILDSQAQWLQQFPNVRVTLEGHCDERGTREYNLALGDRRANAAKNYLASRGVSATRITTISYGKERPAALGSDEESYAANRRAVTIVLN
jgi:peptidoglycan-associated lipoprotein